jgi:hypothetical protein
MLVYLDNSNSTAEHPNENLGRELLELHSSASAPTTRTTSRTLPGSSPAGGSTPAGQQEPDVGRVVHPRRPLGRPVRVMDFTDANADPTAAT